jgi:hypothetical protein
MSTTPRNDLLKRLDALQVESRLAFYHSDANTLSEAVAEILDLRARLDAMCALEELRQARDENAELRKDKARLEKALKEAAQRFRNSTVEWEGAARHCEEALS